MASKIRSRILAAAAECFARSGYYGCSTKEIAARADVTEGSLFRLCVSKDKLFTEALALALAAKNTRPVELRLALFAVLERKGLNQANRKALRRFGLRQPAIGDVMRLLK